LSIKPVKKQTKIIDYTFLRSIVSILY